MLEKDSTKSSANDPTSYGEPYGKPQPERIMRIPTGAFLDRVEKGRHKPWVERGPLVFGTIELISADSARKYGRNPLEDPHEVSRLNDARSSLLERLQPSNERPPGIPILVAYRVVKDAEEMGYRFKNDVPLEQQAEEFLNSLNADGLEQFLRLHIKLEYERFKRFPEKATDLRGQLIEIITAGKESGKLPASFDLEQSRKIISKIEFKLVMDVLWYSGQGEYDHMEHVIEAPDVDLAAASESDPLSRQAVEVAKSVLTHEVLHSVAGKAILRDPNARDDENSEEFRVIKDGLAFMFGKQREAPREWPYKRRFTWLNEAVTEKTAFQILNRDRPASRQKEINLYELLRQKGRTELPDEMFKEAYFEDFDLSAPVGQRLPKWHQLRHAINAAYDRQFLIELDDYVHAYGDDGLDKAIGFFEGLNKGKYGLKNKTLQVVRAEKAANLGLDPKATWQQIAQTESKD